MDKPFKVGDTITSPDRDIEGTVLEIGWRQTVIERFDTRTLYVPNSAFASISVRNHTRQRNRRIFEYVGIRYDDSAQIEAIVSDINEMLRNNPEIDPTNSIMVNFDRFAASSLDIIIYCFTKATAWAEYLDAKQRVLVVGDEYRRQTRCRDRISDYNHSCDGRSCNSITWEQGQMSYFVYLFC